MKKMWTIKVDYKTGNSFGSHDESDMVGYSWNDLDRAKQSLQMIKAHHVYYLAVEKSRYSREIGIKKPDNYESEYECGIIGDAGELVSISAFWHGYFETLHTLTIVADEDNESDMMVEF